MSLNPYAMPESEVVNTPRDRCWREGKDVLYVSHNGDLPRRCVKCNAPALEPVKKRTFYWHSSWLYLLLLLNILLFAIVALIVRKKAQLSSGLCAEHASKRSRILYGSLAASLALFVVGFVTISGENSAIPVAAFVMAVMALIIGAIGSRIIYAIEIDERGGRFKGCGPEFLSSLQSNKPY